MSVLQLCKEYCWDQIPPINLKEHLGGGSDGECFSSLDYPDRVIKLCRVCEDRKEPLEKKYARISEVLSFLKTPPSIYGCVFEYGSFGIFNSIAKKYIGDTLYEDKQEFILHYYMMEKLSPLSYDNYKMLYSLIYFGIDKDLPFEEIQTMLNNLQKGLDFDMEKALKFYWGCINSPLEQTDFQTINVMETLDGDFKIIDFDRVIFRSKK